MNYQEEIIKLVNTISQENLLQFFYVLLRVATSDPDYYESSLALIGGAFGSGKELNGI